MNEIDLLDEIETIYAGLHTTHRLLDMLCNLTGHAIDLNDRSETQKALQKRILNDYEQTQTLTYTLYDRVIAVESRLEQIITQSYGKVEVA